MPPPFAPLSHVRKLGKLLDNADHKTLSPAQKYMYHSEKQVNFRTVAKLCSTRSNYVLTSKDLAPPELIEELAQIGQFAEVVYPTLLPTEFVFANLDALTQASFPLEGYDALLESRLLQAWEGQVAGLDSLIAYRESKKQLVVAFSGTSSIKQSIYDLRFRKLQHPVCRGCGVHSGFWRIYKGIRSRALEGISEGMKMYEVKELVVTGHSLGGAVASLLAFDLLTAEDVPRSLLDGVILKLVGFGSPRAGDPKLVKVWRDAVAQRKEKHGEDSVQEYLIKGYRDGVPSLPPTSFGFQHFTESPYYFYHGRLFHTPPSESEHGLFDVAEEALDKTRIPQYPRGGHNYYNNRDMEGIARRMHWIEEMMSNSPDWESSYRARMSKYEEKLAKKLGIESLNSNQSNGVIDEKMLGPNSEHSWKGSSGTLTPRTPSPVV